MSPNELLLQVEAFLSATGMSPSKFGKAVVGDPGFVFGLRQGREPRFSTIDKVAKFIASQQPRAAE